MVFHHNRNKAADWGAFLILEILALCMLHNEGSVRNTWVGHLAENFQAGVWGNIESVASYFRLGSENKRLEAENISLMEEISRLKTEQSTAGRDTLWQRCNAKFTFSAACVATMTFSSQHNYIIIDKGKNDGVQIDDGLITGQSAAGIIIATSRHHAFAMSYLNNKVTVSAKVGREGAAGTIQWTGLGTEESVLTGIPLHCKVEKGDTVFTSGFSSIFPPDIPIGIVTGKKDVSGSTAVINVRHLENLTSLHHLYVVKNTEKKEISELKEANGE